MQAAFLVFLGGGIGSLGRWLAGMGAVQVFGPGFPMGTLGVNVMGGLVMGVLARMLTDTSIANPDDWRIFLMTGVLGGFTTFSAFSLDTVTLWTRGETGMAIFYVTFSVLGSLAATALGLWLGGKV